MPVARRSFRWYGLLVRKLVWVALLGVACGGRVAPEQDGVDAAATVQDSSLARPDLASPDTTEVTDFASDATDDGRTDEVSDSREWDAAWTVGEYAGVFQWKGDRRDFQSGFFCMWSSELWWLVPESPEFEAKYKSTAPTGERVYVKFEGALSPRGAYGGGAAYPREIVVTRLISMVILTPC